MNKRKKKRRHQ